MKVLTIIGTRPEAIKMAPVIRQLTNNIHIHHQLCITGQHKEMLDTVLQFFEIEPDFNLNIMKPGQDLTDITVGILTGLKDVWKVFRPDWILVHGDTTTCFASSLAAFYEGIKIGHVEAGLRTGNLRSPFPEEANRQLTDRLADVFFVPTQRNRENLLAEGVTDSKIIISGNTVIDALIWADNKVLSFSEKISPELRNRLENMERLILVTGHRRENFGSGIQSICKVLARLANFYPSADIVYPVHLNPNIKKPVYELLSGIRNVHLISPLDYPDFVHVMKKSWIILTDSGGIQEEAPSLGKPVLVMRDTTERTEVLDSGSVKLVGTDLGLIESTVKELWDNKTAYDKMALNANPYGDGSAADKINDFFSTITSEVPENLL
ncbi:UDP-N-acetylglucosamine 2-epimerase [Dyadobacter sp. CECT 9275]|uniref:UDP-N-acetylglucosamine 2-epimerase (non-hydrolyzing) n=1 Tax=Dyadobacter helix TaxID=2822344 RepID=A0A916JHL9_9BACT|nr:UDP-N-acetylglucosamine 2-epimerase (non-hydrolyzing) [Dyadobacter sp. CECT 9275]CAG5008011.1 UDP-N-acetylglucosamine 2-epimerase [Dyadobacter sp. CECT 9275]